MVLVSVIRSNSQYHHLASVRQFRQCRELRYFGPYPQDALLGIFDFASGFVKGFPCSMYHAGKEG